jgi:hypothetical protein
LLPNKLLQRTPLHAAAERQVETKGSGIFFVTVRAENLCGRSDFLEA